jgi:hypothetical protein
MTEDDVSIAELQRAVEHMHGVPARFVEANHSDPAAGSNVRH